MMLGWRGRERENHMEAWEGVAARGLRARTTWRSAPRLGLRLNEPGTSTPSLFNIAVDGVLFILGVLPRCLHHILGLEGTSLGLWWGAVGLGALVSGSEKGVGRLETHRRELFSHMHGTFGVPFPPHCPFRTPPGALPVLHNTLVHRRGLPRGDVVARPPGRIDVARRAPTRHVLGKLFLRGHSAASRHGIETG